MQAKKRLLLKLALGAGAVLIVAAVVAVMGLLADHAQRRRFVEEQKRERQKRVESSRGYLAELAQRVTRLPVDGSLAGEIEARFFEEHASGPFYVWALDARGDFAFGVPRAAFAKLNAIYDSEVTPRLKEGVFLDRQTFLMSLIDDSNSIGPRIDAADKGDKAEAAFELVERGRRFQLDRWEPEDAFVLSAPLKAADGAALGSLYLKRTPSRATHYERDERLEATTAVAGITSFAALAFLWILLPTWVFVDARERGVRRAPLFAFLTVISSLIGLVVYLIARPEAPRRLTCPGCSREVNGGAYCPHCGRDLSAAFCPACRYPLKPEWAFCPSCRAELKPAAAGTPIPQAT